MMHADPTPREGSRSRRAGTWPRRLLAIAFAVATACGTFMTYEERMNQRMVGQPLAVLRGCGDSPVPDVEGSVERYTYQFRVEASELRGRAPTSFDNGYNPRGDSIQTVSMDCAMQITAVDGTIRSVEVRGRTVDTRGRVGLGVLDETRERPDRRTDRECRARFLQCLPEPAAAE